MNLGKPSKDTAFGGDSSWWGSSPALVAGGLTLILAAYGSWILPRSLPEYYAQALERAELAYAHSLDKSSAGNSTNLERTAGELAVIHKRLISLEGGDPARYWGLAEFQIQHAARLRERLNDAAASFLENERGELAAQAERYESQARDTLNLLASGESEFQLRASLQMTSDAYQEGVQNYGVVGAADRVNVLAELLSDPSRSATLSDEEQAEARLLLIRLQIEAAWQIEPGETLVLDPTRVEEAWNWTNSFLSDSAFSDSEHDLRWVATEQLLSAYLPQEMTKRAPESTEPWDADQSIASESQSREAWQWTLAEVEMLAVRGAWSDIGFLLSSNQGSQDMITRSSMGRTVCRLACSAKARNDPEYAAGFDAGLELVYRAAPHVPEFADLIWDSADQHQRRRISDSDTDVPAEVTEDRGLVSADVVSAVLGGRSAVLKHVVLAISMALQQRATVARNHLQLILRSGGDLSLVSRCILRQLQTGKEIDTNALESQKELIGIVVELEPNGGLNWFALANVQAAQGSLGEATDSLEKSLELLGDVPAIKDMLSSIKSRKP